MASLYRRLRSSLLKAAFLKMRIDGLGPEVIFIVKTVHGLHDLFRRQTRILDLSQLVSAFVHHLCVRHHETILHRVIVKFGSRISVSHRNLDSLHVQFLGKVNCVVDGFAGLARQAENEVAMDHQAQLVAILGELAGAFDRSRPS